MHGVRVIGFNFRPQDVSQNVPIKMLWGAKQGIEDRIMAKPYDQTISHIESSIESPKPECWKLKPKDKLGYEK